MTPRNRQLIIQAQAYPDGEEFVAECVHLPVKLRAASVDQAVAELHCAIQRYLMEHREQRDQQARFEVLLFFYFGPLRF